MNWQIVPIGDFDQHLDAWRGLNARIGNSLLLDPVFLSPLIEEFANGDEVLAICGDAGQPSATGIFRRTGRFSWQTFQPTNAPLGPWLCDPVGSLEALLEPLAKVLPAAAVIGLSQLDPDHYPRPPDSQRLQTLDYIRTARLTVAGAFEDYWKQRGKNLRHDMRRQRNRLGREGIVTRLEVLTDPADMPGAIVDYSGLESLGWKAGLDSAVHPDHAQGRFYVKLLQALGPCHQGGAFRYFYNDSLVASDLFIERDDTLYVLKTAYDHRQKGTSPAQLMRYEIIREVFESKRITRIEFYGPVMDWHTKWTGDIRTMYHINYYRWGFASRLHNRISRLRASRSGAASNP